MEILHQRAAWQKSLEKKGCTLKVCSAWLEFNIWCLWALSVFLLKIEPFMGTCSSGPALVFEGEEAMIAAISEDPLSFKASQIIPFTSITIN